MPPDTVFPGSSGLLARAEFDRLQERGRRFLGSRVAIMGGAMSWVSERNLVAAISNAGGFGAPQASGANAVAGGFGAVASGASATAVGTGSGATMASATAVGAFASASGP